MGSAALWPRLGLALAAAALAAAALAACSPKAGAAFRLPDGDALRGRDAFLELRCNSCHDIVDRDDIPFRQGLVHVTLGGPTTSVKTYGELVTSIINPSHRITPRYPAEQVTVNGESLMAMAYLNDVMTVRQLIDLVAFLETTYQVVPPPSPAFWSVYQ